ncbi:MAG: glycosyltransferase family 2 protein [Desulfovibrio sp.]
MDANTRIRVLIHCHSAGPDLFRTLVSLACQTVGPQRLNIVLASTAPQDHRTNEARLLHDSLGFRSVAVLDATGQHPAQALNLAAREGQEETLALVPQGARLSPLFAVSCMRALSARQAEASYCMHTAGAPDATPQVRARPFNTEQLARLNPIGPAALVRREAWQRLGGLRPSVQLNMWDFWLRMALSGGNIARVPELLAFCRPLHTLPPWQDGQAKALLVAALPGAFEPDVCRWALAHLRGDAWAQPFATGVIPAPRDVQAMFAGQPPQRSPRLLSWGSGIQTA